VNHKYEPHADSMDVNNRMAVKIAIAFQYHIV